MTDIPHFKYRPILRFFNENLLENSSKKLLNVLVFFKCLAFDVNPGFNCRVE